MLFCVQAGFSGIESESGDFWIGPCVETSFYNHSDLSYGGGFALGYGRGLSIGVKTLWFHSLNGLDVLELNFLLRFYLSGKNAYSRSFIQFSGGPALLFGDETSVSFPAKTGAFSVGLGYGWRFLIKDRWFIEPSVRVGYPYLGAFGICTGMRF